MTPKEQEMNWLLAMECGNLDAVDKLKAYIKQLERDLALEETGEQKCWANNFNKFELETNDKLVFSYVKAYCEEYKIKEMLQLYKLQQKEK